MSKLSDHGVRTATPRHEEAVRKFELCRTVVEFLAAATLVAGSICFFCGSLMFAGTWLFLKGFVVFAVRPTLRLLVEQRLANLPIPDEFRPYGASCSGGAS